MKKQKLPKKQPAQNLGKSTNQNSTDGATKTSPGQNFGNQLKPVGKGLYPGKKNCQSNDPPKT